MFDPIYNICYYKNNKNYLSIMSGQEATNNEILEAINTFATNTEKRFQGLEQKVGGLEQKITKVEATMVTKDYLDDKLSDLKGDLVVLMRKEDSKLCTLVDLLKNKKIISEAEVKGVLNMQPFP
ncbi:hypothetical protein COT99_04315 [Candidatus Falkowbacteria bacterium CG10_big_fil_rev_8_21_14_0_10_43_10]|uniref:Uncharacterized protein n=1 Tax=Candidatus Falkowbacteria bacterium CG10_big_fil_rev_8_21_14_0_10_43_10 TaxID=1974567 RepID=A0A2H0V153_9BACT|nr:MAG: hypothetical protein COV79_03375 [Parcubacteria group bacterium CG11_big_fil_rev_8_21_14_0_20_41_14]PIR92792.1 MAG: hypothetical protein COT99_04315 [Candidatus Falkowbacteria bacterium CG10_big_fil_rev_8_21_14_0_10_43_10]